MRPVVEIFYFAGCPHHDDTSSLVRKVSAELGIDPDVRVIEVTDQEEAERRRFFGSPTVRVDGRDIEAGGDERTDYVFGCRVYRTGNDASGVPDAELIRAALGAG